MAFLLSAKQEGDPLSWRGATDFCSSFRDRLLGSLGKKNSDMALQTIELVLSELAIAQNTNMHCLNESIQVRKKLSATSELQQLRKLTADFYGTLYDHVTLFRSPLVFYQQSSLFLNALAVTVLRLSRERLGLLERHLPEHALIALGPAGRHEFSPFCPLQMALICRHDSGIMQESIRQYGALVHEGFEACGLHVDPAVSPINGDWCVNLPFWQRTLEDNLNHAEQELLVDLLRLADQTTLAGSTELAEEFRQRAGTTLATSHTALGNLVSRVSLLSNGLGILGRLRLEKSGPYRGHFPLLDHALLPLTSTISAFALISSLTSDTSPQRLHELLHNGELSIDMAEQLLEAWHTINELRLVHEQKSLPDWDDCAPLHLNLEFLSGAETESLRAALESIGLFQRYLYTCYNVAGR